METDQPEFEFPEDLRRRADAATTAEERLQILREWQERYSQWLQSNPEAMERFWRRNLRKRAVRGNPSAPTATPG